MLMNEENPGSNATIDGLISVVGGEEFKALETMVNLYYNVEGHHTEDYWRIYRGAVRSDCADIFIDIMQRMMNAGFHTVGETERASVDEFTIVGEAPEVTSLTAEDAGAPTF